MTTTLDTRLMPAQNVTDPEPTIHTPGREVTDVALIELPRVRERAADGSYEEQVERAMLLESVRQRRKAEERRRAIYSAVYGLRI